MRLKHVKNCDEIINDSTIVAFTKEKQDFDRIKEYDFYSQGKPLEIEIGCGKGDFIIQKALNNPDVYYLAIEKFPSVIIKALKKCENLKSSVDNLLFLSIDAIDLEKLHLENRVDKIYLNFSDPWPKKRHAKRRLTSPRFLEVYNKILKQDGIIEQKTDNEELYEYSLETIGECKFFEVAKNTDDLYHNEEMLQGNIQTEYEKRFIKENKPIHKIVIRRK